MENTPSDQINFAALVAHQLKGPIAAVSSLLQTVTGELAGPITPKQKEILEKSILRCDQSLVAAQRLLTISRAMNNPESFKGQADLTPLLRNVIERYSDEARAKHVSVDFNFDFASAIISADPGAITEVFEALLNNALKYTPENGHIKINLKADVIEENFLIEISDSGIGIPENDMPNLFKPFYRASSATNTSHQGTGLGLSFVKAIVEAAKGTVVASKAQIGGAKFVVSLPIVSKTVHEGDLPEVSKKPGLKVVIIGGVAAGPKVAAKVMRLMPNADVTIVEKGKFMSYAGCGFPYYISGQVKNQRELMSSAVGVVRDPIFFQKVKNVHIMSQTEAIEIDRKNKRVKVVDLLSKEDKWLDYDKLVLATGSLPVKPKCEGLELKNIFTLHGPSDAEGIKAAVEFTKAKDVVIVGGGLIGIEMTEALTRCGCRVNIIEQKKQILPMLDFEMAKLLENHLESQGVKVFTDTEVLSFEANGKGESVDSVVCTAGSIRADLVIISTGIKANNTLAKKANIEIGSLGGIKINDHMQTSDPDIYAAGDCTQTVNMLTGQEYYIPLGSTANKQGRIVAVNICGGDDKFAGVLGTVACKVFDYSMARTGFTERGAKKLGYDTVSVYAPGPDKEHFAKNAKSVMLKIVVDRKSNKLIGAQAIGPGECVKRIDIASMAIMNKMTVEQLANADLCYAPPFSPVIDNIMTAANIAINKIAGYMQGISPVELKQLIDQNQDIYILDVRTPDEYQHQRLANSKHIPLASLRSRINEISQDKLVVTMCNISLRGYEAAIILRSAGYKNIKVLDGGLEMWPWQKIR